MKKIKKIEQKERRTEVMDGKIYYLGKVQCRWCGWTINCKVPEDYREPKMKLECKICGDYEYYLTEIKAVYKTEKEKELPNYKIT